MNDDFVVIQLSRSCHNLCKTIESGKQINLICVAHFAILMLTVIFRIVYAITTCKFKSYTE